MRGLAIITLEELEENVVCVQARGTAFLHPANVARGIDGKQSRNNLICP